MHLFSYGHIDRYNRQHVTRIFLTWFAILIGREAHRNVQLYCYGWQWCPQHNKYHFWIGKQGEYNLYE